MDNKEYVKGVVTGALVTACAGIAGFLGYQLGDQSEDRALNMYSERKIEFIEDLVEKNYLEEIDVKYMEEGLYAGVIAGLGDSYSRYYTAEQYEELTKENDGAYVGIGVVLQQNEDGTAEVVECYKGAPGELAGLLVGDIVVAIDGTEIWGMELADAVNMIQSTEGDSVELLIQREGETENISVTVQIRNVEMQYVFPEMYNEEIGYISITEFSGVTYKQYTEAFKELRSQGMQKLIVDLRCNPGGLYTSVCEILDDILPEGLIVYTEDKYGNRDEMMSDSDAPLAIEMAVLVDGGSASAAEIFAGAIQDYSVGTIVGTTTYGKGVVQSIYQLEDGSAVKLTVSKYFTPNGNSIHEVGIAPDVFVEPERAEVPDTAETNETAEEEAEENKWDNQVQAAAETLTSMR